MGLLTGSMLLLDFFVYLLGKFLSFCRAWFWYWSLNIYCELLDGEVRGEIISKLDYTHMHIKYSKLQLGIIGYYYFKLALTNGSKSIIVSHIMLNTKYSVFTYFSSSMYSAKQLQQHCFGYSSVTHLVKVYSFPMHF